MNNLPPNVSNLMSQLTPQQQQLMQQIVAAQAAQAQAGKPGLAQQPTMLAQQVAAVLQLQQQQQQAAAAKAAAAVLSGSTQAIAPQKPPGPTIISAESAAAAAAKRGKKRKGTDHHVADKAALSIPESPAFLALEELLRRVDYVIQLTRSEIKEVVQMPDHPKRKMRLYVSNTYAHQRPPSDDAQPGSSSRSAGPDLPGWTLNISGRVLDPETSDASTGQLLAGPSTFAVPSVLGIQAMGAMGSGQLPSQPPGPGPGPSISHSAPLAPKFPATFYFRRVEVRLDPEQYTEEDGIIMWDKAQHVPPFKDQLEIKRVGSKPCDVVVTIHLDWQPERFTLDPRLAQVLQLKYETKARIIKAFWSHINLHRLQDPQQPQQLNLPMDLAQVLGISSIRVADLAQHLDPLLKAMEPIVIKHTIKVDGPSPSFKYCYDIDVEAPVAQQSDKISDFVDKFCNDREVEGIDQKLAGVIQKINEHKRRRDLFLGFAHNPADFINAMVASQARDMRTGKHANGNDFEVERRTDLFRQPWAQEAVLKYLQRRLGRSS